MDPKDRRPAEWPALDATGILRRFCGEKVDFVVIGGIAMVLLGSARLTRDLDICFSAKKPNLERLGAALVSLKAKLRGVPGGPDEVPFVPDARTLDGVEVLTLSTSLGWLDVHKGPDGAPPYEQLRRNAERQRIDEECEVLVASPQDMMSMKQAAGRPIDHADISELRTIERLREGGAGEWNTAPR